MSFDTVRKTLAVVSVLVIAVVIILAGFSDRTNKPMAINGDFLGQDAGEDFATYRARAHASLQSATGDSWALLTFAAPQRADIAGQIVDATGLFRASTLVYLEHKPVPVPEPLDPETRADVFDRCSPPGVTVVGVIVYDSADALRVLETNQYVVTIEVLPSDAAYGRFGIRPVNVSYVDHG